MGLFGKIFGSSSSTKTKIPPPTEQEKAMGNLIYGATIPAAYGEAGITISTDQITYDKSSQGKDLRRKIVNYETKLKDLDRAEAIALKIANRQPISGAEFSTLNSAVPGASKYLFKQKDGTYAGNINQVNSEISSSKSSLSRDLKISQENYDKDSKSFTPYTEYYKEETVPENIKSILNEPLENYGYKKMTGFKAAGNVLGQAAAAKKRQEKYDKAYNEWKASLGEQVKKKDDIQEAYIDNTLKYMSGDLSVKEDQKAQVAELLSPIKTAIENLYNEAKTSVETTYKETSKVFEEGLAPQRAEIEKGRLDAVDVLMKTFDEFEKRVGDTTLDTMAALDAVGQTIMSTGESMKSSLDRVVTANKALMDFGIKDYTGKVTVDVANKAASLGRASTDPEYVKDIQDSVAKYVEEGQMKLASMQASGELDIDKSVADNLISLGRSKAALMQEQGGKLEQSALQEGASIGAANQRASEQRLGLESGAAAQRLDTANKYYGSLEQLAQMRGSQGVGLGEKASNLLTQISTPTGQISVGSGMTELEQSLSNQRLNNILGAAGLATGQIAGMRGERLAAANQTTTNTPSPFSVVAGMAKLGAGIASGAGASGTLSGMEMPPAPSLGAPPGELTYRKGV